MFTASHCPQFKASEDSLICLTEYPSEVLVVSANVFTNTEQELTNSFTSIGKLWGDLHKTPLIYTHPNQSLVHACNQLSFPHKHVESGVSVIAEDPWGREKEKYKLILPLAKPTSENVPMDRVRALETKNSQRGVNGTGKVFTNSTCGAGIFLLLWIWPANLVG